MATGLAYHPVFLEHQTGRQHPECPDRLSAIVQYLGASSLWTRLATWEPGPVDEATLRLLHTQSLIDQVRELAAHGGGWIDPDTVVSPRSFEAAVHAAGAVVEATTRTLTGQLANAIALPRPPGHHATPSRAMGFCLFNNVALAAERAIRAGLARRVYVVDLDVHHGNGTQDCFYDRADVLYCSVHQYPFYPGSGGLHERGTGPGLGYTANVPLPFGSGDPTYARVAREVIVPLGERFAPDLVLVSLGLDAFWDDPLAGMALSVAGYTAVLRQVLDLAARVCGGRLVVALEGGYNLRALAFGIASAAHLLLGEPVPPHLALPAPPLQEPAGVDRAIEEACRLAGL
ncbi:MAG: histone deacetylase [Chloroflexi bacterium]|nr:histone deacetylase [Chloroflexota bacterium]